MQTEKKEKQAGRRRGLQLGLLEIAVLRTDCRHSYSLRWPLDPPTPNT